MRERKLFVAVPADRFRMDPRTGAGRVWQSVLARLKDDVRLRQLRSGRPRGVRLRRPDAWLAPGHEGPIERDEPVVVVIHGSAWMLDESVLELMPRAYAAQLTANTEAALESSSAAIVPSEYTRRGLVAGGRLPAERVFVVPHGVDPEVFHPEREGGRALVTAALGERRPYVLFASIPSIAQKNLPALKEAVTGLARRGLPHALVIAGGRAGGEPQELLDAIAADLPGFPGRVAWLGHVDDRRLAGLMAEADAFCLPSLFESFGLTALEAMACAAPAVVSDRGALPEVVGHAALTCEPAAAAIEAALVRVLSDAALAAGLRAAGRARAERMSWERTAEGWHDALRRTAEIG